MSTRSNFKYQEFRIYDKFTSVFVTRKLNFSYFDIWTTTQKYPHCPYVRNQGKIYQQFKIYNNFHFLFCHQEERKKIHATYLILKFFVKTYPPLFSQWCHPAHSLEFHQHRAPLTTGNKIWIIAVINHQNRKVLRLKQNMRCRPYT